MKSIANPNEINSTRSRTNHTRITNFVAKTIKMTKCIFLLAKICVVRWLAIVTILFSVRWHSDGQNVFTEQNKWLPHVPPPSMRMFWRFFFFFFLTHCISVGLRAFIVYLGFAILIPFGWNGSGLEWWSWVCLCLCQCVSVAHGLLRIFFAHQMQRVLFTIIHIPTVLCLWVEIRPANTRYSDISTEIDRDRER